MSDWLSPMAVDAPETTERREGWGMASQALCEVRYPGSEEDIRAALEHARASGLTVLPWGNGRSYGDAALNESNVLLDTSRMTQIVDWDPESGVVTCQPGVTLEKLWKHILRDGWWPPVVSGTMLSTLGGLVAANAHGKNNVMHGPIGDHVVGFTLVTGAGETRQVTAESDPDLFHAAIGGMGWLGVFTSVTLQMKRVYSGQLEVLPLCEPNLQGMFDAFARCESESWDYVVGWIDGFPKGAKMGRGQIHAARYLQEHEDPDGRSSMVLEKQELPPRFFGIIPKSLLWRAVKPFANRWGMRLINWTRFTVMKVRGDGHRHRQEHARFNFLLDYIPRWKWIYKPTGLIQYQFFLPKDTAQRVFTRALAMSQSERLEPWLVVMKRHREDSFWLSHGLDGYSFACDFPVLPGRRGDLWRLTQRFNQMVADAGGRFYFVKDSVLDADSARRAWDADVLDRFFALKHELDPDGLLQSNLLRRIFPDRLTPGAPVVERAEVGMDAPIPSPLDVVEVGAPPVKDVD
ncbi:MAG: FAD/FMN-containing dehydrogenase [Myxococcota bacterium]|jgi:FAD/FMN-containing dehydrogenase